MATNITYTTLFSDIQNYLERGGSGITDPVVFNQIPRLINACERNLMQALKLQGQIEPLTDPSGLGVSQPVIQKPDRWRETVSINFGTGAAKNKRTPLYPRGYEYCRAYWPDDTLTDVPKFYADYDQTHWLIVPTPDQNYPLEALCYMQPPLLDAQNQQNFFTIYCGNALLYGSLLEASPFLKNDDRIPTWQGFYNSNLATLGAQDLQKIMDRSAQRERA